MFRSRRIIQKTLNTLVLKKVQVQQPIFRAFSTNINEGPEKPPVDPVEGATAEVTPVEPAPVEATPVETAPLEAAPIESAPVEESTPSE